MHTAARSKGIHKDKTYNESDGTDHFKVQDGQATGFAHFFHVFHAGDTGHDRTENDGGNNHFDQFDETVTERFHRSADIRVEITQQDADDDRTDHLEVENFIDRFFHIRPFLKGGFFHLVYRFWEIRSPQGL